MLQSECDQSDRSLGAMFSKISYPISVHSRTAKMSFANLQPVKPGLRMNSASIERSRYGPVLNALMSPLLLRIG